MSAMPDDCLPTREQMYEVPGSRLRELGADAQRVTALLAENAHLKRAHEAELARADQLAGENARLRAGYVERLPDTTHGDWLSCRYCKAWAPEARFEHEKGCILDA